MDGQRSSPRSHGSWRPSDRRCRRGRSGGFERFAELAELLGVPVDVVPTESLKPGIRDEVLAEAIAL